LSLISFLLRREIQRIIQQLINADSVKTAYLKQLDRFGIGLSAFPFIDRLARNANGAGKFLLRHSFSFSEQYQFFAEFHALSPLSD
jgi:hypothetical protein